MTKRDSKTGRFIGTRRKSGPSTQNGDYPKAGTYGYAENRKAMLALGRRMKKAGVPMIERETKKESKTDKTKRRRKDD